MRMSVGVTTSCDVPTGFPDYSATWTRPLRFFPRQAKGCWPAVADIDLIGDAGMRRSTSHILRPHAIRLRDSVHSHCRVWNKGRWITTDSTRRAEDLTESIVSARSTRPFYFVSGCGLHPKRPSRPFPPPFLSPPSATTSDRLSTDEQRRERQPQVNGEIIRGLSNGDDAVLMGDNFIGADDGVGAWSTRPKGHAG